MLEAEPAAQAGTAEPSPLLLRALRPIDAVSPELYRRCVDYVHDGSGPEVLLELDASRDPDLDAVLLSPGVTAYSHYTWLARKLEKKLKAVGFPKDPEDAIRKARRAYYASEAPLEAFARLGRLFTCIGQPPNRQVDGVPPWLVALLNDVTAVHVRGARSLARKQPRWTPDRVAALARLDGIAETDVPSVVFWALLEVSDTYFPQPRSLPGVDAFLIEAGPLLPPAAASRLSATARVQLAERNAKDPAVASALAGVLAALACDRARTARVAAARALAQVPEPVLAEALPAALVRVPASQAAEIVDLLSRVEVGPGLLADAVAAGGKIAGLVAKMEVRRSAVAGTGGQVAALVVPPFVPEPEPDNVEAVVAGLRAQLTRDIAAGENSTDEWRVKAAKKARKVTDAELRELAEVTQGLRATRPKLLDRYGQGWLIAHAPLTMAGLLRLESHDKFTNYAWAAGLLLAECTDLRAVELAVSRAGLPPDAVDIADLARPTNWHSVPPEGSWPWFATRPELLAGWLAGTANDVSDGLGILEAFPALPAEVLPGLAALASSDSRLARPRAQAVLAKHGLARGLAVDALGDGKGEIRAAAAAWLARIGDPTTIGDLRAALAKEKREVARAAMLAALEALGDDITADLAPAVLLAEATTGLRAKIPAALTWLDLDHLPALSWADGTPVDPLIVRWWVVLADKLKTPDGSGMIDRYLGLLDADSAATLGRHALTTWIAHDTRHPSEEESRAQAAVDGLEAWQWAQDVLKRFHGDASYGEYLAEAEARAAEPVETHIQAAFSEHQAGYVGSASANKGLLALTTRMPGIELAGAVQAYLRQHGGRRAQIDALMHPLFANGQPACIQLLLSVSRRFPQASVQETATRLAQALADQRGWTADQLADRTIPTAGFGDDRLLHLDFGSREFLGRATPKGTIELSTTDGRPIKALPAARATEDEDQVAQAKRQLTTSRRELKSVLDLQAGRLFEAMAAGRTWPAADWREFLAGHPLVGQLVSRLVWLENPGPAQRTFRPADDGELLDLDDDTVTLAPDALVAVAHRVTVGADIAAAWLAHLDDYAVAPLFAQFAHDVPAIPADALKLDDLQGHLTDTFSFRNVATKRGYTRGAAEDGGCFFEYTKRSTSTGLTAVLEFTGSWVPEENLACATKALGFSRGRREVPLAEVPPILLAEAYADYAALAALGPFDPDWEQKAFL